MKLVLDSNNLAFRAQMTNTGLKTKQGEPVGAIYGFLNILHSYLKLSEFGYKNYILNSLREEGIKGGFNEVICCWDYGASKYRREIYPDYKGHREKKKQEKTPEEQQEYRQFLNQMNVLHDNLPSFGVKSLKLKNWEADDLIHTVTKLTDDICVIVSTDRDMLQLVNDHVFVFSPYKEELYSKNNFEKLTGVPKEAYLDFRALVGDSSDNIKGIDGIGDKTAQKLIKAYKNRDGIKANKIKLLKSKRGQSIFNNWEILERNEKLMDLTKVPTDTIEPFVKTALSMETSFEEKEVKKFLIRYQFISFLSLFLMWSVPFKKLNN